ncbi:MULTISPECIES: hypothetical protein [unclassified Pseudomonas]|uniref:hypothetical protein n=1 Tax=unclassified Pseudomonas TaxID=196821 RepID=UPI000D8BE682|nr:MULTISPECIES: hypothetical protein [unclassified Pseudomonas]PYG73418.1 hypothetical protein N428_05055 [Pseudomonas sp. RV120224-01c]PYG77812.1 hypothetical protein N436_04941 [Pseudomonas sp. RV120224-01b]
MSKTAKTSGKSAAPKKPNQQAIANTLFKILQNGITTGNARCTPVKPLDELHFKEEDQTTTPHQINIQRLTDNTLHYTYTYPGIECEDPDRLIEVLAMFEFGDNFDPWHLTRDEQKLTGSVPLFIKPKPGDTIKGRAQFVAILKNPGENVIIGTREHDILVTAEPGNTKI